MKQNLLESLKTECLLGQQVVINRNIIQTVHLSPKFTFQTFRELERDRCVIYVTSLGVVRRTLQRCCNIRKILRNLCVR